MRGQIPDVDGALVEAVLEHEIEQFKPPAGQAWETRDRRGADALAAICRRASNPVPVSTTKRRSWRPTVVVHVGSDAQPIGQRHPDRRSRRSRSSITDGARVREVHDDDPLAPATGDAIPAALRDYLVGRDSTCRVPECGRAFGLDAHHIVPRCRGGCTDKHNVVLVCSTHHHRLIPHGPWVLDGDPEQPDGLHWHRLDDDTDIEARAGPAA